MSIEREKHSNRYLIFCNLFCALFDELSCVWRWAACLTSLIFRVLATFFVTSDGLGTRNNAAKITQNNSSLYIGAVVNLKVEDYFHTGKRSLIRFREKGGKETEIPVHHKLEELLGQYLEISGLRNRPTAALFPIALGKTRKLGNRPATRIDAARMLKRRLKDAGLSDAFSPHSFRATGITNFLENGGTLEVAQRIAGHADSRTRGNESCDTTQ
jgi:integrase